MDLRAPLQLQSVIKSMTDVVLPAIDPHNRMAQEQAQLILGMLHLLAQRLPLQFQYDVDELQRYVGLSSQLLGSAHGGPATTQQLAQLEGAAAEGARVLAGAQLAPATLEASVLALRNDISALIRAVWEDGAPECRPSTHAAVMDAAKAQILRERAWFQPQGWDADPSAYPAIETLLNPFTDTSPKDPPYPNPEHPR